MKIEHLNTVEAPGSFLDGNQAVVYSVPGSKAQRYELVRKTLVKFGYASLSKKDKGTLIRYLLTMTDYSRQQLTRLIRQYIQTGKIKWTPSRHNGFAKKYRDSDFVLLAKTDEPHDTPSGPTTRKRCERAHDVFDDNACQRLSTVSVSHLYNPGGSRRYKQQRRNFTKTQARQVAIGEKRKPRPDGKPGYIRIDTVHQGDQDGVKGVYHINAVDERTRFETVCSVEKISERYLLPALEQMLASFPFTVQGFHSDNGSEYVNKRVAKLLEKLFIEFTGSRQDIPTIMRALKVKMRP